MCQFTSLLTEHFDVKFGNMNVSCISLKKFMSQLKMPFDNICIKLNRV